MSEELKACPFCDGLNISMFYWDNALVWKIVCLNCGCEKLNVDKLFLIRWWNTRPLEDALRAQHVAEMEAKVEALEWRDKEICTLRKQLDIAVEALQVSKKHLLECSIYDAYKTIDDALAAIRKDE